MKKILIIGSGPIIIGQAAEFDYSGTQACLSLMEEGYWVELINNNPATIMTDSDIANKIHIKAINKEEIEKIIIDSKIDAILPNCGGQTALNIAIELAESGVLARHKVKMLGVNLETIKKAEDRNLFKKLMEEIGEPICNGKTVKNLQDGLDFASAIGFPIIVRPSFTLGGTGGGVAMDMDQLKTILSNGLSASPVGEVLVEQSILGWSEIEYEIIRDANDTCISVCNMENFDPVGVHTGDSIVVAPSQTLSDMQYHKLRSAAIKIVRSLKIEGACNVQFGFDHKTSDYIVIEVNPRVSRSSALASKATAYPIAKVAAKIAIGKHLHEIINDISGSVAALEPSLDYLVFKLPVFPFDKFKDCNNRLGTQMKATGEHMGIGRDFKEALLKCISIEKIQKEIDLMLNISTGDLLGLIPIATEKRIYQILSLLSRGIEPEKIAQVTMINPWFIRQLADVWKYQDKEVFFKSIDGSAGEFSSRSNYVYSTKHANFHEVVPLDRKDKKGKIIVIGSSAIKIGHGIEFDYAGVHAIKSLKKLGYLAIMINDNPETISTDYNIGDRLYFEPIRADIIKKIYEFEEADGVMIQFGGQAAIGIAHEIEKMGLKVLGTSVNSLDISEDRSKFGDFLRQNNINTPKSITFKKEEIKKNMNINFPAIVRPSYVIGGSKMKICRDFDSLNSYLEDVSSDEVIFIDEFIDGIEYEADIVATGENIFIPLISEHIDPSGIHSGDSRAIFPCKNLSNEHKNQIASYSKTICKELQVFGLMNIQFVVRGDELYIIEVNLRSSRTVPIINKVCNIDIVDLAVQSILNLDFAIPMFNVIESVKIPVFSNHKITDKDIHLGPEMLSTGEYLVAC